MIICTSLLEEREGYQAAWGILHKRFRQQDLYLHEVIYKLIKGPVVRNRDGAALMKMADEYFWAMRTMKAGIWWQERRTMELTTAWCAACPLRAGPRYLTGCKQFGEMTIQERMCVVTRERICFLCLKGKHMAAICKSEAPLCDIDGCGKRHARIIHTAPYETRTARMRAIDENEERRSNEGAR